MISLISRYELAFGILPDEPVSNQVIYVENGLNPEFSAFVEKYLDRIKKMFCKEGLEFIYLKNWLKEVSNEDLRAAAKYYVPWLKPGDWDFLRESCLINTNDLVNKLTPRDKNDMIIGANGHAFKIIVDEPWLFHEQLYQIASAYGRELSKHRSWFEPPIYGSRPPKVAEEPKPYESSHIEPDYNEDIAPWDDELTRKFKQVRRLIPEWAVREMLADKLKNQEVLSSIRIGRRPTLFLPEYDIQVNLRPIEMAFYLIFLKHPEGIEFKKMIDHRDELLRYYYQYANKGTREEQAQTIDKLVEPLNYDDRDTQRSRIQRAINDSFRYSFCERYACNYTIVGERNEPKYIKIAKENKLKLEIDL